VIKEEEDWPSASDTESDVTELDENASEPEYFPGKSSLLSEGRSKMQWLTNRCD
jgi:hypothetical protein